ncbi:Hypothetical predicted protein [Paramuricea clavata]|uniref:Uncharacterized protein n=1 Tax=Paramuricea clavata TaxID=317549 RepID=A0A7D9L6D7_PARCT|nr:Hypothetical predicted protein [Paramuricea clavata]
MNIAIYVFVVLAVKNGRSEPNTVLFTKMGKTAVQTSFGHMVVELPINDVYEAFEDLSDLTNAVVKKAHGQKTEQIRLELYQMKRLLSKVQLVWSLASQKTREYTPFELDHSNVFNDTLWSMDSRSDAAARGKRNAIVNKIAATTGILNLAAFGLSLYNRNQLGKIFKAVKENKHSQYLVAEQVDTNQLRIFNATVHIDNVERAMRERIQILADVTAEGVAKTLLQDVRILQTNFKTELTDFINALVALTDHRFSPMLVDPEKLEINYQKLLRKARDHDLKPLTEDAGLLFQSVTNVITSTEGRLYAVVHIPLYKGDLMTLYRYVPAPFFIHGNIAVKIAADYQYIALNPAGTMAKQLTAADLQNCKEINHIYHCPRENVINKNLKDLCLYNLYHQNVDKIEDTCTVQVFNLKSHAVQLSGNEFRILSTEPVQLVQDCGPYQDPTVTTIQGVHILKLTTECPTANTPTHLFTTNPQVVEYQDILSLPLITKADSWLKETINEEKASKLNEIIENWKTTSIQPIPIHALRSQLKNYEWNKMINVITHVQYGITMFCTLALAYVGVQHFCKLSNNYCMRHIKTPKWCSGIKRTRPGPTAPLRQIEGTDMISGEELKLFQES